MRTIETDLVVTPDGKANVLRMPPDVRRGKYHAVVVIDDAPLQSASAQKKRPALRLSSYSVGVKDQGMTFSTICPLSFLSDLPN